MTPYQLGKKAFQQKKPRVPSKDSQMIHFLNTKNSLANAKEWLRGYDDQKNLNPNNK